MPFLATDQNEDEDQQGQPGQPGQGSSGQILSSTSGGSTAAGSGQSAAATTGANLKGTSSGAFTNLNSYIGANQGQGAGMGARVGDRGDGLASNADTAGTGWKDTTSKMIQDNTIKDSKGLTTLFSSVTPPVTPNVTREADVVPAPPKSRGPLVADPTAAPKDVKGPQVISGPMFSDVSSEDFNHLYNGVYAPTAITGTAEHAALKSQYGDVEKFAQMAGGADANLDSRGQVLRETFGGSGKQYTKGENLLDGFITGASEDGLASMKGVSDKYGAYGTNLTEIEKLLAADDLAAGLESETTVGDFKKAVDSANTTLGNTITGAIDTAADKNQAVTETLSNLVPGQSKFLETMSKLAPGVSYGILTYLLDKGFDFSPYITGNAGYAAGDFVSTTDAQSFAQLQLLLDGAGGPTSSTIMPEMLASGGGAGGSVDVDALKAAYTALMSGLPPIDGFGGAYSATSGNADGAYTPPPKPVAQPLALPNVTGTIESSTNEAPNPVDELAKIAAKIPGPSVPTGDPTIKLIPTKWRR